MNQLNNKYFKSIYSEEIKGNKYTVYQPLNYPMILFSKVTGLPLASLHFICPNKEVNTLVTKRLSCKKSDFQCLINKSDQEFQFVISNLTNYNLNFNILMEKGTNINKINCLSAYKSVVVQSDVNNKAFVLSSVKNNKGDCITVKESEVSNNINENKGTYFYLSVVPESKKDLVEQFKETNWQCVDLFCTKEEIPKESYNNWFDVVDEPIHTQNRHLINVSRPLGINTVGTTLRNATYDLMNSPPMPRFIISPLLLSTIEPDVNIVDFCSGVPVEPKIKSYKYDKNNMSIKESSQMNQDIINNSNIGKMTYGRDMEDVISNDVNIEFDYNVSSIMCKIGLSIEPNVKFINNTEKLNSMEDAKKILEEFMSNKFMKEITVYNSNTCAVCLEDNKDIPIDSILYQCGHKCCHHGCLNNISKCPICRTKINAYIKI